MRSLNRYLTALLMCLVFCQGLMGAEKREMTIKASISKECGGGKLWAFSSFREPRHGLVAVARKDASGKKKWGFMSMTGRIMVPMITGSDSPLRRCFRKRSGGRICRV